ncbi:type II secretion system protein N [Granulosicoccaceae sp. 1_MG-2023]|nr:type II secretion system protein N [Granulosicoccaceae sp. 1_MG-2023]
MKRLLQYVLTGVIAYILFFALRFPASAVISRVDTQPARLDGVSGSVFNGRIATVTLPNTALPTGPDEFLIENVSWGFAPLRLFSGAGAADVAFDAYQGTGEGRVAQRFNGVSEVKDFHYATGARGINVLLDPLAEVAGELSIDIDSLTLREQLLESMTAVIEWRDAALIRPLPARLGRVEIQIEPKQAGSHLASIRASGGELIIDGTVTLALNGDFNTDLTIRPAPEASRELTDMLRAMARPASDGSFRVRRSGNMNRLM